MLILPRVARFAALFVGCLATTQVANAQFFPPAQQRSPAGDRYAQQPEEPRTAGQGSQAPPTPAARPAEQPPQAAAPVPLPPPFQLTPPQEQFLDQVLDAWQKTTGRIKTFKSDFTRWEYDPVWAVGANKDKALTISSGRVMYAAPDKGTFRVAETKRIDPKSGEYVVNPDEVGEHWVCDGKRIWEFNAKEKLVIERRLPPELQGKAISSGPLPFLFGVEAPKLKDRYYLRIITPQDMAEKEIWLDARPKYQIDAQNFRMAVLILDRNTFHPFALRLYEPVGEKYTTYQFADITIDDPFEWFKRDFAEPRVPFGWKKLEENIPQAEAPPEGVRR